MYSSFLLLQIASPTYTTAVLATLDNIITNNWNSPYTSGNLVITLSDHCAQFLIMENKPDLSESKKGRPKYLNWKMWTGNLSST